MRRKQECLKPEGKTRPPDKGSSRTLRGSDYGSYRLSLKEWMTYGLLGVGVCGLIAYTFYRSLIAFVLLLPFGAAYPLYKRRDLRKERFRRLTLQFKEGILILSSFLGAGYSMENGLAMSIKELEALCGADAMITEEFRMLSQGIKMNRPIELLLEEFGERSHIQDVNNFAQVFAAARRSGGELVEIIGNTASIIRDKIQVQEEIYTMTAARIFEQKIMDCIPFAIILYIDITSPGFFTIMYSTWAGRGIMTACLILYAAAVLLSRHILDIEV